jgi:hypothetical protein
MRDFATTHAPKILAACGQFRPAQRKNNEIFAPSAPFRGYLAVFFAFRISSFGFRISGGRSGAWTSWVW